MIRPIHTAHGALLFGVVLGLTSTVNAGIIASPAPLGFGTQLTLNGSQGDPVHNSRWFDAEDGEALYTAWANEQIDFTVSLGVQPADYMVGVTAKNWTSLVLPGEYEQFKVGVSVNDTFIDYLYIDASDDTWNTAWIDVGPLAGAVKLTLNWVNDSYYAGHYDANIAIGAVQFASSIPTPATGTLLIASLMLASSRRRRD